MCFKGRKKYSLRKRQYKRKKQKESGKKYTWKKVFCNLAAKEK